ncbi:oxygen-insensitive NADPH nitroreductase [Bacillus sp. FJAT-45350]|uniref:oxygen-insensitive NADPH nitroreductase n=1 Tax=Bacillus sp. FJAT-45350 TaxID=2011014 RepID=UPI000BB6D1DE|nr:oxygen-insensitive NADPH nitroreductase [Bacillus sp. FJAT-45350]
MNETIEMLLKHKSIRKFEERSLTEEQIHTIVQSAQAASTSSYIQAYSIIGVKDVAKKEELAELAGNQNYVASSGHFFIFCADLHRHEIIGDMKGTDLKESLDSTEKFMVAVIDAALAAQNATVAAESLGLGICYIGGIRNHVQEVSELLNLPHRVIPLFGLTVGYPAQDPGVKPRLPLEHIYYEDEYPQEQTLYKQQLNEYDKVVSAYYHERTGGKRANTWSEQMSQMLAEPKRMFMKDFVEKKGFSKK